MSFIYKLFCSDRQKQLDNEKIIDEILLKELKNCPHTIASYFLKRREINRNQFNSWYNSSIVQQANIIDKNMEEIYADQAFILGEHVSLCDSLEKYLSTI